MKILKTQATGENLIQMQVIAYIEMISVRLENLLMYLHPLASIKAALDTDWVFPWVTLIMMAGMIFMWAMIFMRTIITTSIMVMAPLQKAEQNILGIIHALVWAMILLIITMMPNPIL